MSIKRSPSPKISLSLLLIVPFVSLIVGAVGLVGYLSYQSGQEAVKKIANQLMVNTGKQVNQELNLYLHTAHEANQRHIAAINAGVINLENIDQLHRYLILQHRQSQTLTTFLFGSPQGDFRLSHRVNPSDFGVKTFLQTGELPFEIGISKPQNPATYRIYSVDESGNPARFLQAIENLDVRDRPWYRQAVKNGKAGWSQPFQIGSTSLLAINAYAPFYDKSQQLLGVFSVNISLNQFGDFLRSLKVGQTGGIYIMDRNGLLIANSTTESSYFVSGKQDLSETAKTGTIEFKRLSANQLSNSTIQNSYNYLKESLKDNLATLRSPQTLDVSISGKRYFLNLDSYQDNNSLDWLIVTVVPESDFMEQINANVSRTITLCGLTLSIAIGLGLWTSRRITAPILRLSRASRAIANGDWQETLPENNEIAEMNVLATSFNKMTQHLRHILDTNATDLQDKAYWFNTLVEAIPDAIFLKDGHGRFLIVNHQGLKLFNMSDSDYLGKTDQEMAKLNDFYHDALLYCAATDQIAWNKKTISRTEERLPLIDGGESIFDVVRVPLFKENGDRKGLVVVGRDISDRKRAESDLQVSKTRLSDILNSTTSAITRLTVKPDDTWVTDYVSSGCEVLSGYTAAELNADQSLWINLINPEDWQAIESQVYADIFASRSGEYTYRLSHKDGTSRWISQANYSRWDAIQNAWIVTIISSDISDRKQAEEQLQKSEAALVEAQAIAHIGNWSFDIPTQKITWSKELFHMFGLDPNQPEPTFVDYLQLIHHDDRMLLQECIERASINEIPYAIDYRAIQPDGSIRYHEGRGEIEQNEQGQVVRLFGTNLDITDRKLIEIELTKAKEVAETATLAKSAFLANMSHEIRTPMNGILGMAQLLETTELDEEQQDFVTTIKSSGDSLLAIINDILDLSKIEAGMLTIEADAFSLDEVVNAVFKLLQNQAIAKNISLQYNIAANVPTTVISDRARLRQILLNLVGNAIKFTQQGQVTLSVNSQVLSKSDQSFDNYQLRFAIADTGIGIQSDQITTLFQPFTQADSSISRKYGGTGLGLAISKRLVELMGGKIWVESFGQVGGDSPIFWQSESNSQLTTQGSVFYFTIAVSIFEEEIARSQGSEINQTEIDPKMAEKMPLRILLAEDNPFNQTLTKIMFKKFGYAIDIANNGLEALEAIRNSDYDLILMDMQMPKMDGLTATKVIRTELKSKIKIIAMTANAMPEDRQACLDAGMDDYMSKPIDIYAVMRLVAIISQS